MREFARFIWNVCVCHLACLDGGNRSITTQHNRRHAIDILEDNYTTILGVCAEIINTQLQLIIVLDLSEIDVVDVLHQEGSSRQDGRGLTTTGNATQEDTTAIWHAEFIESFAEV